MCCAVTFEKDKQRCMHLIVVPLWTVGIWWLYLRRSVPLIWWIKHTICSWRLLAKIFWCIFQLGYVRIHVYLHTSMPGNQICALVATTREWNTPPPIEICGLAFSLSLRAKLKYSSQWIPPPPSFLPTGRDGGTKCNFYGSLPAAVSYVVRTFWTGLTCLQAICIFRYKMPWSPPY